MALTVDQLREHVTTSLGNDALQRLLNDAYGVIDEELGPTGNVTVSQRAGNGPLLPLARDAETIVSVTEDATGTPLALAADDYRLRPSGGLLERLRTGTNPRHRWYGIVDVTLTPADDAAARDRAAIDLVRLELNFNPGLASYSTGVYSESYATGGGPDLQGDYAAQRQAILASLHPTEAFGIR